LGERRLFRRTYTVDGKELPLYEAYAAIWASDNLQYNGGGVTHATAYNFYENKRIRIKTFVNADKPAVRTVSDLFSAANWMERETYDFYGIIFEGHPNLKRILNVEYLDYFPMRKEYPLEDPTREDKDNRFFGR